MFTISVTLSKLFPKPKESPLEYKASQKKNSIECLIPNVNSIAPILFYIYTHTTEGISSTTELTKLSTYLSFVTENSSVPAHQSINELT